MQNVQFIFITMPSYAQKNIFKLMLPHLQDNQTIITLSGNFASLCFQKIAKESGVTQHINYAETSTMPHVSRIETPGNVTIFGIKKNLSIGFLSEKNDTNLLFETLQNIFSCTLHKATNILDIGFNCLNGVAHPAVALLNTGWIENTENINTIKKIN